MDSSDLKEKEYDWQKSARSIESTTFVECLFFFY